MSFWESVGRGVGEGIKNALEVQRGRMLVQSWADLKVERACAQIQGVVAQAIADRNGTFIFAILNEFGELLKNAESWDQQQDVSLLLWHFKECVSDDIDTLATAAHS
jgi:hypothetical protein